MAIRKAAKPSKEGLPGEAFAIVGEAEKPETWKLPHHTQAISRAVAGRLDTEHTVDWECMAAAVAALSPGGYRGQRLEATPGEIIAAARHLAGHYRQAGNPPLIPWPPWCEQMQAWMQFIKTMIRPFIIVWGFTVYGICVIREIEVPALLAGLITIVIVEYFGERAVLRLKGK